MRTERANAKINAYLNVTGRRENGYHDIESIMHTVSLCDIITVELCDSGINLSSNFPHVPTDERNIAYKAAKAFFEATGLSSGAAIHIEKHIPVATFENGVLTVNVGSVDHPMTEEHLIEWVYVQTDRGGQRKVLNAGDAPKLTFVFTDEKPVAVYAYCNLHGLWKTEL
jgi:desulfoferrodoxin